MIISAFEAPVFASIPSAYYETQDFSDLERSSPVRHGRSDRLRSQVIGNLPGSGDPPGTAFVDAEFASTAPNVGRLPLLSGHWKRTLV